jgi:hypothetical protein
MMTFPLYGIPPYRLIYGDIDLPERVHRRALEMGAVWQ